MYLVHTELLRGKADLCIPQDLAHLLQALAHPSDGLEHVVIHPHRGVAMTVGVYVLADRLQDAEETAARLCRRAVAENGPLRGWRVGRSEVPLLAPFGLDDFMD